MNKIIIITTIALSTLTSVGAASAANDIYTNGYRDWAQQALSGSLK